MPVLISKKHQLKSIGYPVEISMKYKWNQLEIQLEFDSNFNGLPLGSIVNPVEISMIYQLKFQWNAHRNNWKSSSNFNKIPMEIHWKSGWNSVEISMKY